MRFQQGTKFSLFVMDQLEQSCTYPQSEDFGHAKLTKFKASTSAIGSA